MKTLKTFDKIFAWLFFALAIACAYGIITKALFADAKKEEAEQWEE